MLSQVGCITLPPETLAKVYGGQPMSRKKAKLYESHPEVAGKLLGQIPRLEDVAGMVAGQLRLAGQVNWATGDREARTRNRLEQRSSGLPSASINSSIRAARHKPAAQQGFVEPCPHLPAGHHRKPW